MNSSICIYHIINLRCLSVCKILTKCLRIKMLTWVIFIKAQDKNTVFRLSVCVCVYLCVCLSVTMVTFLNYSQTGRPYYAIFDKHTHMIPRSSIGYIMSSRDLY